MSTGKRTLLDTNIIIRFLTQDSASQSGRVRRLLADAPRAGLELPDIVVAEIVYVLLSVYNLSKEDIVEKVSLLIELKSIKCNRNLLRKALDLFMENNISFVDAYLGALISTGKSDRLFTFDRKLRNVLGSYAVEPK